MNDIGIEVLKGKIIREICGNEKDDELIFVTEDGERYKMYHSQDCCENVFIEDICGELEWILGSPILLAEERCSDENPLGECEESFTWTFYEIATLKGAVTIRWYGSSNGYYSESVEVVRI